MCSQGGNLKWTENRGKEEGQDCRVQPGWGRVRHAEIAGPKGGKKAAGNLEAASWGVPLLGRSQLQVRNQQRSGLDPANSLAPASVVWREHGTGMKAARGAREPCTRPGTEAAPRHRGPHPASCREGRRGWERGAGVGALLHQSPVLGRRWRLRSYF